MPDLFALVPECHVDTALAHALVHGKVKLVEHCKGKAAVGTRLSGLAAALGPRQLAVGLVDHDDDLFAQAGLALFEPHSLAAFSFAEHGFQVYAPPHRPTHFLIVLEPACDKWLFREALAAGLTALQYPILSSFEAFKKVSKPKTVQDHPDIVGILRALLRQPSPAFQQLLAFVEQQLEAAGQPRW